MTISSQTFRWPYTATAAASTLFPYSNKILDQDDLKVYVSGTLKTIGTDYSVTGVGVAAGGNVSFVVAPSTGASVLLTKDGVEFTQGTDYVANDAFPAESHEDALDKLTNIAQKIWDYTRRSVKLAITSTLTDLELPTPEASKYIGWNATADGLENLSLVALGAISDAAYNSTTWDGETGIAPSKNAVRDIMETKISSLVEDTTPELGGDLDANGKKIEDAIFLDCGIVTSALGALGAGDVTIDLSLGNNISLTIDAGATLTFSNAIASDDLGVYSIWGTNIGSQVVSWTNVNWGSEGAPSFTAAGLDVVVLAGIAGTTAYKGRAFSLDCG